MRLRTKFIGAVLCGITAVLAGTAGLLVRQQNQALHREAEGRALRVLSFGEACRQYARETLSPAVRRHTDVLIFEADSATFVARGTFEAYRQRFPEYSFREAALNPLNPENRADAEEVKLIRRFQQDPKLGEITGFRAAAGGEQFYVARPIVVQKVCLQCHRSPETAPPEVVERYGRSSGYGWQEGEINSAIMVTVPAADLRAEQTAAWWILGGIFGGLAIVLAAVIWLLFDKLVTHRLARVAEVMGRIAGDPQADARVLDERPDEIGAMGGSFNRMADALRQSHLTLEKRVAERTAELERFNQLAVGREQRLIALKRQVNEMAQQLGQAAPYDLAFVEAAGNQQ